MSIIEQFIPQEDRIAEAYFSNLNLDLGYKGILAVVATSTALLSQHSGFAQLLAYLFLVVLIYCAHCHGKHYRTVMHRYLPKHRGVINSLLLIKKFPLFVLATMALWFTAIGAFNLPELVSTLF